MVDWVRANHGFHDVIYRVANLPLIEQLAKSARRTFSGPAVWAPGDHSIDELYLKNAEQHRAIRQALAARQPRRRAGACARTRALVVRPARDDPRAGRRAAARLAARTRGPALTPSEQETSQLRRFGGACGSDHSRREELSLEVKPGGARRFEKRGAVQDPAEVLGVVAVCIGPLENDERPGSLGHR